MHAIKLVNQGKVDEGIKILEKLAADGDDLAMVQLGTYYYEGQVVGQDDSKAMDWFLQAYTNHNADAFVNLGVMHRNGNGVPANKKIAYLVFLTTHMCGLGSEYTQSRADSYLRRILEEMSLDDVKDCLSNYTPGYLFAYLEAKGKLEGIPDEYKPSEKNPAFKDLDWWLDGELDAIFGEPPENELATREEQRRDQQKAVMIHRMVFEIRVPKSGTPPFRKYEMITAGGLSSGSIPADKFKARDGYMIYEGDELIFADAYRYLSVEANSGVAFIFKIDHPVKPEPRDWGAWQKPSYAIRDPLDKFALMKGGTPASRMKKLPSPSPEIRFKVVK